MTPGPKAQPHKPRDSHGAALRQQLFSVLDSRSAPAAASPQPVMEQLAEEPEESLSVKPPSTVAETLVNPGGSLLFWRPPDLPSDGES